MHICYKSLTVDLNDQIRDRVRDYLAYAHRAIRTGRLALTDGETWRMQLSLWLKSSRTCDVKA